MGPSRRREISRRTAWAFLLGALPAAVALVIGSIIARFNLRELGHPLWLSLLYGFGIPLLLVGLHYWSAWKFGGHLDELECALSFTPLVLFLFIWPVYLRVLRPTIR